MQNKSILLLCCFFIFFCSSVMAGKTPNPSAKLIVGIKETPPFSMKGADGHWQGISVKLWESIAEELGLSYEYQELPLQGILDGLSDKSLDVGFSALTITAEREKLFDFTHPFYTTGLGIAAKKGGNEGLFAFVKRFLSLNFLQAVFSLAVLIGAFGLLVWMLEKDKNREQFGGTAAKGIGAAFWWSAVTMTTVGYGDKAPKTLGGRIVATIWMFMAVIVISSFTAAITSSLTISNLQSLVKGPEDLPRVRVGTIASSTSSRYLDERRISCQQFTSANEGLRAMAAGDIDALVYDAPTLRYLVKNEYDGELTVLKNIFQTQQYGIGVSSGSPLREQINRVLLKKLDEQQWHDLLFFYLGQ
jgi:ABC-type amino acid transport substrate-binding protein